MKMLKDNSLKAIIGMMAFAAVLLVAPQRVAAQSLSAQLTDKDITVSEFNAVNVSDDFEVTVSRGTYGVRLTVDKELAPYVEVYVRSKVLYISYDEKAVPKELRKQYRGKGALTPVFRVVAYTPELQAVTLSDNATLTGVEEFTADEFELTMAGKSQVKNLSISATSARISMKKNAVATLNLKTDRGVEVNTDNSANLKLTFTGRELALTADGSSVVIADGGSTRSLNLSTGGSSQVSVISDTEKVEVTAEGSSKLTLTGKALEMEVKGSRSSVVDAFAMPMEEVEANLSNSSTVTVSVSKKVSVNLVGGSSLFYSGSPVFEIEKIVKSTLAPYGTK
ncbi:MAG: DUF2807 domain-containing protein [Bacteroidales bacterium]|nr:DUF2807 domain-containing protein [Bacteroidales bacterium]